MYACKHGCMYACNVMNVCDAMNARMCVYVMCACNVCMYVGDVCMRVCMYACMRVFMYVCMYVRMQIFTHAVDVCMYVM